MLRPLLNELRQLVERADKSSAPITGAQIVVLLKAVQKAADDDFYDEMLPQLIQVAQTNDAAKTKALADDLHITKVRGGGSIWLILRDWVNQEPLKNIRHMVVSIFAALAEEEHGDNLDQLGPKTYAAMLRVT